MHYTYVDRQTASSFPQAALELRGDYGGHAWIICEASHVKASDEALEQLAVDLGARFEWSTPDMNFVSWTLTDYWHESRRGLRGDEFLWALRIHPALLQRGVTRDAVEAVLFGQSDRLAGVG